MLNLSVQGLSKTFARQQARRSKGVATDGPQALAHLVRQTLRRRTADAPVSRDDRRYFWALDDVTFDVAAGEVLGIIGRNGAGKSTLLKILARVLHPTTGRAEVRGRVVSMLELGIGFAPELTVRQNIQIHGRLAAIPARRIAEREDAVLELAGLTDVADERLRECPGGTAVQLGFAAMVTFGAEIILADEVLAVGDSAFRQLCEDRVRDAGASGESVLFVSHDMSAIRRVCTRVLWIDKGRVVMDGATDAVVDAYSEALLAGRLLPPIAADGLGATCRLLDARLLDEQGATVGAVQLTRPAGLECLLRIDRPDVAALLDIELWRERHCLFKLTSQPLTVRHASTIQTGITLPADFLNELTYQAKFRLRVVSRSDATVPEALAGEETLEFSAMNPHPAESVWRNWPWNRNGLVSPRLAWRIADVD